MRRSCADTGTLLPGLPDELALLCLAKLPLRLQARCRCVSRALSHALRPAARRQELAAAKEPWILLCVTPMYDCDDKYRKTWGPIHWFLLDPLFPSCSALPSPPAALLPADIGSPILLLSDIVSPHTLPLSPFLTKVLVYGLTPPSDDLLAFDLLDRQWCSGAPPMIDKGRCNFAFATLDGCLYIAGGLNASGVYRDAYRTAERFDLTSETWECLPDMHKKRHISSGFAMDGCFYVVGGMDDDNNHVLSGEFFDPKTGMWTLIPEMWPSCMTSPETEWEPPVVAMVNNHLYMLKLPFVKLFWYDKQRRKWVSLGDFSSECEVTSDAQFLGVRDELWILSIKQEGLIQVFSCKPQGACSTIQWQSLAFQLGSNFDRVLSCLLVEL